MKGHVHTEGVEPYVRRATKRERSTRRRQMIRRGECQYSLGGLTLWSYVNRDGYRPVALRWIKQQAGL